MDHGEDHWKKQLDKFKVTQRCPKCGELSLRYVLGKLKCSNCDFEQNVGEIK